MIIAISGKAQSGKDTVCEIIQDELWPGYIFENHKFAESLKLMASVALVQPIYKFEDIIYKKSKINWLNITVREYLQKLGTAMKNEFGADYWCKCTLKSYTPNKLWIISDLRYKVELEEIKRIEPNAYIIRINRPNIPLMNHSSEIDLDDYKGWDYIINNDGSCDDLVEKVKTMLGSKIFLNTLNNVNR